MRRPLRKTSEPDAEAWCRCNARTRHRHTSSDTVLFSPGDPERVYVSCDSKTCDHFHGPGDPLKSAPGETASPASRAQPSSQGER